VKRTPIDRKTQLKRRARPPIGTREQREAWKREVCAEGYATCSVPGGEHEGPIEAHHVISQEKLKDYARGLRLDADQLAELIWDKRNGIAVCRRHHDLHTRAIVRLPRAAVTPEAREFAHELGLERLIDRGYPRDPRRSAC
jgi:hypothetical protein